jgi:hypothetical protein
MVIYHEYQTLPNLRGRHGFLPRYFSAYASSEAVKEQWIEAGMAKGWVLK